MMLLADRHDVISHTVKLPASLPSGKIVAVELGFRELRLTLRQTVAEPVSAGMNVVIRIGRDDLPTGSLQLQ